MIDLHLPFSGRTENEAQSDTFDPYDTYNQAAIPQPGPFLEDHRQLTGRKHVLFHRLTKRVFERGGVYDVTFGYNLARLNQDRRHPNAGFRYAIEGSNPDVLRAEFTPTTAFCPQSQSLTTGAFRAWNGQSDCHEFEQVRVRVHPMHHQSDAINSQLASLESTDETANRDQVTDPW